MFKYKKPSAKRLGKRAAASGALGPSIFTEQVKSFKASDGSNKIRILPPTWKDASHWGLDIWVHYSIGPDNAMVLCPKHMQGEPCPICEERLVAERNDDEEYAKSLKPNKRVLIYLIDKKAPAEGLQVWSMPQTLDQELCTLAVDEESKEVLPVDDPKEGYNITFKREGTGVATRYKGVRYDQHPSALGKGSLLKAAIKKPLDELLNLLSYDQIQDLFMGGASKDEEEEDDEDFDKGRKRKGKGKKGKKGKRRSSKYDDEDEDEDEDEDDFDEDDYED